MRDELDSIHTYLYRQYVLLGNVIDARKLHHFHFYALMMDYGHKSYLDKLINQRNNVYLALECLAHRTTEVLYAEEEWLNWVRSAQSEEEQTREKEKEKVKAEAALFQRHWKGVQASLAAAREREHERRQDAYLEEVWKERMADEDFAWDPAEDFFDQERGKFVELIREFLWLELDKAPQELALHDLDVNDKEASSEQVTALLKEDVKPQLPPNVVDPNKQENPEATDSPKKAKKKAKAKKKKTRQRMEMQCRTVKIATQ